MTLQERLEALARLIKTHKWEERPKKACFRVVYELPAELQLELTCFMVARYLPIFEQRYPECPWPRRIIDDLSITDNYEYEEVEMPDDDGRPGANDVTPADRTFIHCFNGLSFAYYDLKNNRSVITQLCMATVCSAIEARAKNVWQADQPEESAIVLKRMNSYDGAIGLPYVTPWENVAYQAVEKRECTELLAWLVRKGVANYPVCSDGKDLQKALDGWVDANMAILVPEELFPPEQVREKDARDG